MRLPTNQTEILSSTLCGTELTFRKVTVEDITNYAKLNLTDRPWVSVLIEMLASLMHGYEESLEERIAFIKTLPVTSFDSFQNEALEILQKIGLFEDSTKPTKKKK